MLKRRRHFAPKTGILQLCHWTLAWASSIHVYACNYETKASLTQRQVWKVSPSALLWDCKPEFFSRCIFLNNASCTCTHRNLAEFIIKNSRWHALYSAYLVVFTLMNACWCIPWMGALNCATTPLLVPSPRQLDWSLAQGVRWTWSDRSSICSQCTD